MVKIARGFGGYGMPLTELAAAGSLGLMRALARFEPERGFRFASYAMWWVRAAIREHVLRNRWLVTIGTTTARKKLVFNLRRLKSQRGELGEGDLPPRDHRNRPEARGQRGRGDRNEPSPRRQHGPAIRPLPSAAPARQ